MTVRGQSTNLCIREVGHVLANLVSRSNNYAPRGAFLHSTVIITNRSTNIRMYYFHVIIFYYGIVE